MKRFIYKFSPLYKTTLWGGDRIADYKNENISESRVGESWEISAVPENETVVTAGEDAGLTLSTLCRKYGAGLLGHHCIATFGLTFPLLIKIIDAREDLSVQVHPDDCLAGKRHGCPGKTEMWYVVKVADGASIYSGFHRSLAPGRLAGAVACGEFKDYLARYASRPGDSFFIPAGRVHSIGAGNLLIEIQQSSDVTYRIDDFGRIGADGHPRELHLDQARDAINYSVGDSAPDHPRVRDGEATALVDCPYFTTDLLLLTPGEESVMPMDDSFRVVICVEGEVTLEVGDRESVELRRGHSALVAADASSLAVKSTGSTSRCLLTRVRRGVVETFLADTLSRPAS